MGYRSDIEAASEDLTLIQAQVDLIMAGIPYALKYDQDADPPTQAYLGQAQPGSSVGAAVWRIQKLVFSVDGDVTATWADGDADFDNVWNNRASLNYS